MQFYYIHVYEYKNECYPNTLNKYLLVYWYQWNSIINNYWIIIAILYYKNLEEKNEFEWKKKYL